MRVPRALIAMLLLAVSAVAGSFAATGASFTSATSTRGNTVTTATLAPPTLSADGLTATGITMSWTPAPGHGTTPTYTLARTAPGDTAPTVIYAGGNNTYTDPGALPPQLRTLVPTTIASGEDHSLVLTDDGTVWAWGYNGFGQLGNGTRTNSLTPVKVSLPSGVTITAIAAGRAHSLAIDTAGAVWAWGFNGYGQLGNGTTVDSRTPTKVELPGVHATVLAAGRDHSLAIDTTGAVYAWGYNIYGQLGNGTTADSATPVKANLPPGLQPTAIAGGWSHSLALDATGTIYAWGHNGLGQLGNGTGTNSSSPVKAKLPPGFKPTAIAVGVGANHSLALDATGTVHAWGYNRYGQLGDGTTTDSSIPRKVDLPSDITISSISAGTNHSFALDATGTGHAWGYNKYGQLGDGTTTDSSIPRKVDLPSDITISSIDGGWSHSLALDTTGTIHTWGNNMTAQLENGAQAMSLTTPTCPTGAVLAPDGSTCSLAPGTTYTYTVTTTVGGWNAISSLTALTTSASP